VHQQHLKAIFKGGIHKARELGQESLRLLESIGNRQATEVKAWLHLLPFEREDQIGERERGRMPIRFCQEEIPTFPNERRGNTSSSDVLPMKERAIV
jgi:hypothetical protein